MICRSCESFFTALFGDSYCINSKSTHYWGKDGGKVLDFDLCEPPIKHNVKKCKYFIKINKGE